MTKALLKSSLAAAVPVEIVRLSSSPWSDVVELARECANVIAAEGDNILYRSKKMGGSAKAFASLARGLAALSFTPGGVNFLGLHFRANHPECEQQGELR